MFGDLDWSLNASRSLSAIAEFFLLRSIFGWRNKINTKVLDYLTTNLQRRLYGRACLHSEASSWASNEPKLMLSLIFIPIVNGFRRKFLPSPLLGQISTTNGNKRWVIFHFFIRNRNNLELFRVFWILWRQESIQGSRQYCTWRLGSDYRIDLQGLEPSRK